MPPRRSLLAALLMLVAAAPARAGSFEDFFRAVPLDDARTVGALLARGFDANAVDEKGQPALFLALRDGADKVIALLLEQPDLRVDQPNALGETPLMMAALRGRLEWSRTLLARGAAVNREGWAPLHYAASGPEPAVVALLLERGAALEARSPNGSTALMMASRYGSEASVDLLLARGADARLRNQAGLDAAAFARGAGRESLARRLESAAR
ncbi:MAG: ankyrin repeat domain-containing protein [Rubrivivax sp.]